jgi:hypothetical protein
MDLFNRSRAKRGLIAALDLQPFVSTAVELFGLTPENIAPAMTEYRHFLYLVYWNRRLEQTLMIVPTKRADALWHAHILHTRSYREMCQSIFGQFIDHNPGLIEGSAPFQKAMRHTRDVHNHITRAGKEPGFDDAYFAFLDSIADSDSARRREQSSDAGGSDSTPVLATVDAPVGKGPAAPDTGNEGATCGDGGGGGGCGGD